MTRRAPFGPVLVAAIVAATKVASAQARDGESLADTKKPEPKPESAEVKPTEKPVEKAPATSGASASTEEPKSPWDYGVYGWLRFSYDYTTKDDRYDFVGSNNGFVLDGARVGL